MPPIVMIQSAPCATASAIKNSNFLTLLPLNCIPERSSRYIFTNISVSIKKKLKIKEDRSVDQKQYPGRLLPFHSPHTPLLDCLKRSYITDHFIRWLNCTQRSRLHSSITHVRLESTPCAIQIRTNLIFVVQIFVPKT